MPRRILFATWNLFRNLLGLQGDLFGKAGNGAFVAYQAVAFDNYLEDQRVIVAIGYGGDDAEAVAAGFAFHPELLAGAAPEGDEAGGQGFGVAGFVEKSEHEDFSGSGILDDAGDEAVHFFKVDLRCFCSHWDSLLGLMAEILA
jgi:hypothetical protein